MREKDNIILKISTQHTANIKKEPQNAPERFLKYLGIENTIDKYLKYKYEQIGDR